VGDDLSLLLHFGKYLDREIEGQCLRNFLIEKLLQIRPKRGGVDFLRLNRAQIEYSRACGKRNIVLKARQLGITTYIAARFFIQTITHPGTVAVQVAHTQESAEAIFTIVRRFWEKLPGGPRRGALVTSRANVRQLAFPMIDSEYRVETADANAGRGMTIHYLHCSEVSRWPRDASETLASLRAAVAPEGEVVLESTPNGAAGTFYQEWQGAIESGYVRHFFPWWYEDGYRGAVIEPLIPNEEEKELIALRGLDHAQIAWRRTHWQMARALAKQEYAEDPCACFLLSGDCVFDLEAIGRATAMAGEPLTLKDNGQLAIWLPAREGREYIIGVDPAGGGSNGDYSCAQVIEKTLGLQCAELRGHFSPFELARRVVELGGNYGRALLAVERNNHGYGVLAHLRDMEYSNIFEQGGQLGWLTSAVSRPAMIENMTAMLIAEPGLFRSMRLLEECRTFVRRADGNAAAADGAHDDCVMAMAIAFAVRRENVGRPRRFGMAGLEVEFRAGLDRAFTRP
jgi:hypothetical protein